MHKRIAFIIILAALLVPVCVTSAFAAEPFGYNPPARGAQLVSRSTVSGTDAVRSALSSVNSVKVGQAATTINVTGDQGPHAITVDYGELSRDKRAAGLGLMAGVYVGLGAITRVLRLLRATGLLGH